MPAEKDLFVEESTMVTMSFGDHIEELRVRLMLALIGLVVGLVITCVPPFYLGKQVMTKMEEPATLALKRYYEDDAAKRAKEARETQAKSPTVKVEYDAKEFVEQLRLILPDLKLPDPTTLDGKTFPLVQRSSKEDEIRKNLDSMAIRSGVITLGPLEGITILLMVCMITGLVITSPWVFYQAWAFVAAGLYRHERHYVLKFLPISLFLFLFGVFLCFFAVLPVTLGFLLDLNVWLNIEPSLRLSEWMSFATILPLVFGLCFQTPLVMLFLEKIGILTAADFRSKRKYAILIIVALAAILTPGPDVFSQCMLAVPMVILYELGILLMGKGTVRTSAPA